MAQIAMRHRVVAGQGLPHETQRFRESGGMERLQGEHAQADDARPAFGLRLGDLGISLGDLCRTLTDDVVAGPLPKQRRQLQGHVADLVGQRQGALEDVQRRRRRIALVGDQRLAKLQVQTLLAAAPLHVLAQGAAKADAVLQAGDGLHVRRPRQGLGAGLLPVAKRPLGEACRLGMLRLDLRACITAGLKHIYQTGMEGEAPGFQQALIGRVADQGVLEEIGGVRRRAAAEDQLGLDQAAHGKAEFGLGQGGQRGDSGVVEGPPNHSRGLRHLLDRVQSVKPGHQRIVQAGRDGERAQRGVQVIGVCALAQRTRFEYGLGHFLDEQPARFADGPA